MSRKTRTAKKTAKTTPKEPSSGVESFSIRSVAELSAPYQPRFELKPADLRNGLIVRTPNGLGESVMCLPALAMLKKSLPAHCGLCVVCPEPMLPVFGSCPAVDAVVPLSGARGGWTTGAAKRVHSLRMGAGLILRRSADDALHLRAAGVKTLCGLGYFGSHLLLGKSFRFARSARGAQTRTHLTAAYASIAAALGAASSDGTFPAVSPEVWFERADSELTTLARHPKLLLLSSGVSSKTWELGRFQEVAGFWISHGGIVAALDPGAREDQERLTASLPRKRVFVLPARMDVLALMRIAHAARAILTCDDGIGHLGALAGTGGVALFASGESAQRAPIGENWRVLTAPRRCSPCRGAACGSGRACLNAIPASAVIGELERFL